MRRRGEGAQHLVVVGPAWSGAATDDLPVVRAPTNAVWLLGRTLADPFDGDADGPWNDYFLTAKGARPLGEAPAPAATGTPGPWPSSDPGDDEDFLGRLAGLMARHPPPPAHGALVQRLAHLGVNRFSPFSTSSLPPDLAGAVRAGVAEARRCIEDAAWPSAAPGESPWIALSRPGNGRLAPLERAAIVRRGFGFNLREDAIYFLASQDSEGRPLHGDTDYRLHFPPQRQPPVGAYWSLTAYDLEGRLAAPIAGRVGLSSREPLRFNLDGSLDLRIRRHRPAGPMAVNWLPTPPTPFRLVLRAYWPGKPVLDGRWTPPPLLSADAERSAAVKGPGSPVGAASGRTAVPLGPPPDTAYAC